MLFVSMYLCQNQKYPPNIYECLAPTPTLMPLPLPPILFPKTLLRWSSISAGVMGIGIGGVEDNVEVEPSPRASSETWQYRSAYVVSRPIRIPLPGITEYNTD